MSDFVDLLFWCVSVFTAYRLGWSDGRTKDTEDRAFATLDRLFRLGEKSVQKGGE